MDKLRKALVQVSVVALVTGGALGCRQTEVGTGGAGAPQGSHSGQGIRGEEASMDGATFLDARTGSTHMAGGRGHGSPEWLTPGSSTNAVAPPDIEARFKVGLFGQHWVRSPGTDPFEDGPGYGGAGIAGPQEEPGQPVPGYLETDVLDPGSGEAETPSTPGEVY